MYDDVYIIIIKEKYYFLIEIHFIRKTTQMFRELHFCMIHKIMSSWGFSILQVLVGISVNDKNFIKSINDFKTNSQLAKHLRMIFNLK